MGKKLTFKEFEERSNEIHNGKYTYHERRKKSKYNKIL